MNFYHGDRYVIRFNEADGKYWKYLEKNIVKKIYDGSNDEKWYQTSLVVNNYAGFYLQNLWYKDSNDSTITCNYFTQQPFKNWLDLVEESFIETNKNGFGVRIEKNTANTTEEFKLWLSTHNLEVIYKADNSELIPLEPLDIMNMTYYPLTNAFTSIDNIFLKAKYYRDFVNTIRNMQIDNGTLKAQLQDIEKRLSALENKPTIEPQIEPTVEEVIPNA